jgi:hypothetical protein
MTLEDLARRAVACKHWRWRDGSKRVHAEHRWAWRLCGWRWFPCDERSNAVHDSCFAEAIPDLSDPATIGCLLALVREAWTRDPEVNHWVSYAVPVFDGLETWRVGCILDGAKMFAVCNLATMTLVEGKTEAEALVAALEAAP